MYTGKKNIGNKSEKVKEKKGERKPGRASVSMNMFPFNSFIFY